MNKKCIKCDELKSLEEYYKNVNQCKSCIKEYKKNHHLLYKETIKNKNLLLTDEEKSILKDKKREYYEKYKETGKVYKNMSDELKKSKREHRKIYHKIKMETDILYRLKIGFQRRLNKSLKRNRFIYSSTLDLLNIIGCSFEDFKLHIESNFDYWMNWENYGKYNGEFNHGWDIDHIIPASSGKSEEEIIQLNHYNNLRPLCSKINRDLKRNKLNFLHI